MRIIGYIAIAVVLTLSFGPTPSPAERSEYDDLADQMASWLDEPDFDADPEEVMQRSKREFRVI